MISGALCLVQGESLLLVSLFIRPSMAGGQALSGTSDFK